MFWKCIFAKLLSKTLSEHAQRVWVLRGAEVVQIWWQQGRSDEDAQCFFLSLRFFRRLPALSFLTLWPPFLTQKYLVTVFLHCSHFTAQHQWNLQLQLDTISALRSSTASPHSPQSLLQLRFSHLLKFLPFLRHSRPSVPGKPRVRFSRQ